MRVGEAGDRAILAGDNSSRPRLIYLGVASAVAPGDRIVTSGDAGAFPPGLPVGRVVVAEESNTLVEPYFSRERLQFVDILDFGLSGILAELNKAK